MRKLLLVLVVLTMGMYSNAQDNRNYVLEIDGDTMSVSLDKPFTLKTSSGKELKVRVSQKKILQYSDDYLSFQYPSSYALKEEDIEEGVKQVLCMDAIGNGFLIQEYAEVDPELLTAMMLNEITTESRSAGYTETIENITRTLANGTKLKGMRSTLVMDDEKNIYEAFPVSKGEGGSLIVFLIIDPDDIKGKQTIEKFWQTLEVKK